LCCRSGDVDQASFTDDLRRRGDRRADAAAEVAVGIDVLVHDLSAALLAICYLGILLAPDLSVHLASDPQEPGLAGGNWRGAFGHKNQAAAIMRDHMVRAVRNYPRLDVWLKRAFGKPLSREEN
jgi:hypothetical protein